MSEFKSNPFEKEAKKLILVTDWEKYFNYPKIGTLRNLIFRNTDNFKTEVVRKIAGRVLIDVDAYFIWVDKINGITLETKELDHE